MFPRSRRTGRASTSEHLRDRSDREENRMYFRSRPERTAPPSLSVFPGGRSGDCRIPRSESKTDDRSGRTVLRFGSGVRFRRASNRCSALSGRSLKENPMVSTAQFEYGSAFARNLGLVDEPEQARLRKTCVALAGLG